MLVDRGIAVFFGIARVAIQLDNYLFFRTVYEYGECICLRLGFAAAAENQLVVSADGGLQFFFYGVIAILAAFGVGDTLFDDRSQSFRGSHGLQCSFRGSGVVPAALGDYLQSGGQCRVISVLNLDYTVFSVHGVISALLYFAYSFAW